MSLHYRKLMVEEIISQKHHYEVFEECKIKLWVSYSKTTILVTPSFLHIGALGWLQGATFS